MIDQPNGLTRRMRSSRPRICVTGLRGIPGVIGGVETHCEELLPRIAAIAPEIDIEVLGRSGYVAAGAEEFRGVKVSAIPAPKGTAIEAIVSTTLAVLRARPRASAVHIHAIGPGLVVPLAKLLGLRVIFTHHGADYERAKWGWFAKSMLRLGEYLSVSAANEVIAVAPSLAARLNREFPRRASSVHYIPNGVPLLEEKDAAVNVLAELGLTPGSYILAVGRLVPEKGLDYLIDAYRRSRTSRKLVIVGSAIHYSAYSRQLLKEADDRVRFLGAQPRHVLKHLYVAADLFVLASFHEGLPISALEAASSGAPVLLSDIGPNRDIGLPPTNYFPVGNVDALACCLDEPSKSFQIDSNAILGRFDWDEIARETAMLYRKVLAEDC